jgi:hypothetical protein
VTWLVSAEDLKACAELVGERFVSSFTRRLPPGAVEHTEGVQPISFGPILQMLAGYSIEALVKGILLRGSPTPLSGASYRAGSPRMTLKDSSVERMCS